MLSFLQLELPLFRLFSGEPAGNRKPPAQPRATPKPSTLEEPRSITLGGQKIDYVFRRSARRRSLSLMVDTRGLRVAAPARANPRDADELIYKNARWVLTKLKEWQAPHNARARAWMPGDALPYFGEKRALTVAAGKPGLAVFDDALILTTREPLDVPQVKATLEAGLRERAREHFLPRLQFYARTLGVATPDLRLSSAATRWGSCSRRADGVSVSLNWRLIHFPARLIDYVIAHEIAHIKHMNHSARSWAVVAKLYPDYAAAKDEIKRRALELPDL